MTIGHHAHLGAGRPLEHPGWNLKPTVGIGAAQITAKNNSVRLLDSFVNADPKSKPRVPWVLAVPETQFRGRSQALLRYGISSVIAIASIIVS